MGTSKKADTMFGFTMASIFQCLVAVIVVAAVSVYQQHKSQPQIQSATGAEHISNWGWQGGQLDIATDRRGWHGTMPETPGQFSTISVSPDKSKLAWFNGRYSDVKPLLYNVYIWAAANQQWTLLAGNLVLPASNRFYAIDWRDDAIELAVESLNPDNCSRYFEIDSNGMRELEHPLMPVSASDPPHCLAETAQP